MLLKTLAEELELRRLAGTEQPEIAVSGAYVGDLLSLVMANARRGDLWITHQGHQNIVAVASLLDLAGIIIAGSTNCLDDTVRHALTEQIPLFASDLPAFELAGRLFALGLRAQHA
jgi:hypothetical protein